MDMAECSVVLALTGDGPGSAWVLITDVFFSLFADYHIHNAKYQNNESLKEQKAICHH